MREQIYKNEGYSNLKEMLQKTGEKFGDRPAYIYKTEVEGKFREISHKQFRDEINNLGTALISLGLKDKRIAVISENRYEWGVAYFAAVAGTGVVVPLDKALPANEIENLMIRSEVEAIIYSKKYDEIMNNIKEKQTTKVKYFISMDLEKKEDDIYSQKELIEQGKKLIEEGKVKVNGNIVTELGTKVSGNDTIEVDGTILKRDSVKEYYLLNKPRGVISSVSDDLNRPTVVDYIDTDARIYPVGRLDYDTTGLLIMSNDGEFANMIMHPRYHLEKIYEVSINGLINGATLHKLEKGIYLEGVKTLPCKIKVINKDTEHKTTVLQIKLYEGKNRQVKKMFESVGHPVKILHRVSIGCVNLKGLTPGKYRILKPQEVKDLKKLVNGKK